MRQDGWVEENVSVMAGGGAKAVECVRYSTVYILVRRSLAGATCYVRLELDASNKTIAKTNSSSTTVKLASALYSLSTPLEGSSFAPPPTYTRCNVIFLERSPLLNNCYINSPY